MVEKIKYKNRVIAEVYNYLDFKKWTNKGQRSKESFIEWLVEVVSNTSVGYAGFKKKSYLKDTLLRRVFGRDEVSLEKRIWKTISLSQFSTSVILSQIEKAIKRSNEILSSN